MSTLTVSQLNNQIRTWLEHDIGEISVTGELSNLSKPSSGHYYFTLKDEKAQLRAVFFRNYHTALSKQFTDGQQVIAYGKLSLYEARGDYQLIVQDLKPNGLGELYRQFELLKNKLENLGLFAAINKKPLPSFPLAIGIITSSTGAALQDILTTLNRRFPLARVFLYACEVQGKTASLQLVNAIKQANYDKHCEVLILARGGGSLEDLWAFNDELLALTISKSSIPIVSGVGHETDFTIADFVADFRAATPTAAAEAVTPDRYELLKIIDSLNVRLFMVIKRIMQQQKLIFAHQKSKLSSPEHLINKHWQALDFLQRQLPQSLKQKIRSQQHQLQLAFTSLQAKNPATLLQKSKVQLKQIEQQLLQAIQQRLQHLHQLFASNLTTLQAVNPLATLERGYALATYQQHVLFDSQQVNVGDKIALKLAKGDLVCQVIAK